LLVVAKTDLRKERGFYHNIFDNLKFIFENRIFLIWNPPFQNSLLDCDQFTYTNRGDESIEKDIIECDTAELERNLIKKDSDRKLNDFLIGCEDRPPTIGESCLSDTGNNNDGAATQFGVNYVGGWKRRKRQAKTLIDQSIHKVTAFPARKILKDNAD
jgi:hypothetical protein